MKYIELNWNSFKDTLAEEHTDEEIEAVKLVFYAGSISLFNLLMNQAKNKTISQSEGAELLSNLHIELDEFIDHIEATL